MSSSTPNVYDPEAIEWNSYLKLWGTRGSVPVSGPEYTAFGGNTSCLEIRRKNQAIIVDAGTGIRALGDQLIASDIREVHLLFGHTHWDHIIGFPFFLPLYDPSFTIHMYAAPGQDKSIQQALSRVLTPDYFPVRLDDLKASIHYHQLSPDHPIMIGDITSSIAPCDHPGGALAFKFQTQDRSIGYVTDNEFLKGYHGDPALITLSSPELQPYLPLVDFLHGCDPLIHEAQYTPREYRDKTGWGHSSISNVAALVKLIGAQEWYVTHHDPAATDVQLRARRNLHWQILCEADVDCHVHLAHDTLTLPL